MTSKAASEKKRGGHRKEDEYASLIGGEVETGTEKKDVTDAHGRGHSVKGGKYSQVFLYSRERFVTNTTFWDMGLSQIFIDCLDAFPDGFDVYKADKFRYKERLRKPMRALADRLNEEGMLEKFLNKSFLEAGREDDGRRVDFLAIKRGRIFHVFKGLEVGKILADTLQVRNSVGRGSGQVSDQKVLVWHERNVGEVELRNDSSRHYRQMKFRMNLHLTADLLMEGLGEGQVVKNRVRAYGEATKIPFVR
ncbi:MAG: hypothetical protein MPK06_03385 [Alphaproteobacteria bacterium]|nr:hypothetical protein [Alphaproteobacteria bacterium]MDA8004171.1 hypothetical protein [Alphaproteobacteria bacterium]MDA8005569.1 hypothetical protein [Alphaproteobacteria bacterium]MDA8012586.1 hypothetical protein [Alphaproteobacteria bacterium]